MLRNPNLSKEQIEKIIDELFEEIIKKTLYDGSCSILNFGKFFSYKVFSNFLGKFVPRFKFSVSRALTKKIRDDLYIQERMKELEKKIFELEKKENPEYIENRNRKIFENKNRILYNDKKLKQIAKQEKEFE